MRAPAPEGDGLMSDLTLASALASDIRSFLEFKAAAGVGGKSMRWYLRDLDGWCEEHGMSELDRATVEGYVLQKLGRTGTGYTKWVSYLREFARWLQLNGHPGAYVLPYGFGGSATRPLPYLLSEAEIEAFFRAAASYSTWAPMRWEAKAVFGLMHSCGLRTCEVVRLRPGDVDVGERRMDIMWSKGNRSRRLGVSDEVADMLAECGGLTTKEFGAGREAFFVTATGRGLSVSDVDRVFRRIWGAADLPVPTTGRRATPYAFRHHFAYANIERWGREGRDVMAMLPYLARYMGHSSFDSTLYYVHTSPDFMSGFSAAASSLDALLPEVGFDGQ